MPKTKLCLMIGLSLAALSCPAVAKDIRIPDASYTFEGHEYIVDYKYSDKNQWRWADIQRADRNIPALITPEYVANTPDDQIEVVMQAEKALRAFLTEKTCIKGVLTQAVFDRYDHDYEFIPARPMSVYLKKETKKAAVATSGQCHAVGGYPDHVLTEKELKRKQKAEARAAKEKAKLEKKAAKAAAKAASEDAAQ